MGSAAQGSEGGLGRLLSPASVLVYGASNDPDKIGGRPLRYLREAGYEGRVYAVNPRGGLVQGVPASASARALGEPVDLAIIAVPAAAVPAAIEDCAQAGVRSAVLFSAGFAEASEEGRAAEQAIVRIARTHGMRLLGPNCLGLFDTRSGCMATFTSTLEHVAPKAGPLAIVSQSGAIGSHLFVACARRGIGVGTWVSTGNECDVDVADCLLHLAGDDATRAALIYLEGVKDGRKLVRALTAMREAGKPVIALKVGRSEVGARAAASHTAALAGRDAVFDAVLRDRGALRADSIEDAVDAAYVLGSGVRPAGRRLGIMTISGGAGVLMSDAAAQHGLDVPPLSDETQERLRSLLGHSGVRNPVDTTGRIFSRTGLVGDTLAAMLDAGGTDAVVCFFSSIAFTPSMSAAIREQILGVRRRYPDRLVVLSILCSAQMREQFEAEGILVFEDPSRAVAAVAQLCRIAEMGRAPRDEALPAEGSLAVHLPRGPMTEHEALEVVAQMGIGTPRRRIVRTPQQAAEAAREIGFPVVLKISSAAIAHKTEVGGVVLGLRSERQVADACRAMLDTVARRAPDAPIDGVLVAGMVEHDGAELILGVVQDPSFGPTVMLGSGGILAELLGDVSFRPAPFGLATARRMIDEVKASALLKGFRGRESADLDRLAQALVRLSRFAADAGDRIASLDINPLVVCADGIVALDALVELRTEGG